MVCSRSISPWKNRHYVWSGHHHRGSSRFFRCQNSLHQHRRNDGYDRGIVFSRAPWPPMPVMRIRVFIMTPNTHVQLALACQQSMLKVQHRSRLTMQHVCGHTGNLGNECADHAVALGTFGQVSNHNLFTRWVRHDFDTAACFVSCNNIRDVLENCVTPELKQHRHLRTGFGALVLIGSSMTFTHGLHHTLFALCPFPVRSLLQSLVVPYECHGKPNFVCLYHFEFC